MCRQERDRTFERGIKYIDAIVAIEGITEVMRGVEVTEYSKKLESDHRGYFFKINIKEYFEDEFKSVKGIKYYLLDSSRKTHRKRFIET